MALTVIIASFGDDRWIDLADERALPSVAHWPDVFHFHWPETGRSVGAVRNLAVEASRADGWICFLDPDDELAPGYLEAMTSAAVYPEDLYAPALKLGSGPARVLDDRDIVDGLNPCPIGTVIHRDTFDRVGGFWDERAWEDWSLFRRVALTGGSIHFVPDAVYKAYPSTKGRNSTVTRPKALRAEILDSHQRWMQT